jgi:N-ethylmaleimide reductase
VSYKRTNTEGIFMSADLREPFRLSDLTLLSRVVMAPMTPNCADENGLVSPMMVDYYRQRAGGALLITESSPVSPDGVGYPFTPLVYKAAQAKQTIPTIPFILVRQTAP